MSFHLLQDLIFFFISHFTHTGISPSIENSKIEDDVVDEEDDGQRRRKRPKKIQVKDSLDPARIYQTHPLKLTLQIHDDEASDPKSTKLIVLKFEYLLKLNVVCVGIEGSNEGPESNILCNLFPNDTGLELPHQVFIHFPISFIVLLDYIFDIKFIVYESS